MGPILDRQDPGGPHELSYLGRGVITVLAQFSAKKFEHHNIMRRYALVITWIGTHKYVYLIIMDWCRYLLMNRDWLLSSLWAALLWKIIFVRICTLLDTEMTLVCTSPSLTCYVCNLNTQCSENYCFGNAKSPGPLLLTRIIFNPRICPVGCEMKLVIHSQTTTLPSLKFENGNIIHPTLYDGCIYLSMPGLKLIHVSKRGPSYLQNVPHPRANRNEHF